RTRHRSAYTAETVNDSLVIDEPELASSARNDLGSISGHHATTNLPGGGKHAAHNHEQRPQPLGFGRR
ncbi:MAG: hypothetical protein ACI89X_003471, partial [Planctomycetota bacterium]